MPGSDRYPLVKRTIDVLASAGLLLMFLPFAMLIAGGIAAETPGPVLFRQKRVGRDLREFSLLKFRSMVSDAASKGPYWTSENDSRITRVGQFLRRTSLDEVPQLWNVLIGEMSLIGPRPDTPAQQLHYTHDAWVARHRVRPGMTGLAQVGGRSQITPEERTRLDLEYANAPSWALDKTILIKTLRQVLGRVGVN